LLGLDRMIFLPRRLNVDGVYVHINDRNEERSSYRRNQYTNQRYWSEDIEDRVLLKTCKQWYVIDQTLFDEEDQLSIGLLFHECLQWRNQLIHLRILGRNILKLKDEIKISTLTYDKNSLIRKDVKFEMNNGNNKHFSYKSDYSCKVSTYLIYFAFYFNLYL
jgi:hypothetical protein